MLPKHTECDQRRKNISMQVGLSTVKKASPFAHTTAAAFRAPPLEAHVAYCGIT